jgi:hypothetical protein
VGIELVPSRKQIREVDAVVVPCDQIPPASKERPADPPRAEEQRLVPEAPATSRAVVFDGEGGRSELRPETEPIPSPVEQIETEGESVLQPVVHTEIVENEDDAAQEPYVEPEPAVDTRICSIAVWRGYRKATFYAEAYEGDEAVALAESPTFKYKGNGIPDQTEAAAEAHRALMELLRQEGWQSVQQGPAWFEQTLTRS